MQALRVTTLRVRLIHVKDLVYANTGKPVQTMINVKIHLEQGEGTAIKKYKSAPHSDGSHGDTEGDGVIEFDQVFLLDDLLTMSAELHIRVFECSVLKDQMLAEALLPLREDLALSSTPTYVCGTDVEDVSTYVLYARDDKKRVGLIQLGLLLQ